MTTEEAYEGYLAAIRAGDRHRAFAVIERATSADLDIPTIYLEVFQPVLREIGRLWEENRLTVAEEHLATSITQTAMLRLYSDLDLPESSGRVLIAACADSERHEVGLRMLCDILELSGWETVFLGATVPSESLVKMVANRRPDAVALSASITPHLVQVGRTIRAIREAAGDDQPVILVGGRAFHERPQLATELGADLTAPDAVEAAGLLVERVA
jgi:MerR family transcriptional regulator, light-induced transcriptional regulator